MARKHLNIPSLTTKQIERFWRHVATGTPDECWEWTGHRDKDGYGGVTVAGIGYRATRIAYFIHYQSDPDMMKVLHRCDNPPCCNPTHLFLGTTLDNNQDREQKRRGSYGDNHWTRKFPERLPRGDMHHFRRNPLLHSHGEAHHRAKLTEIIVREIRAKYIPRKYSYAMLAREYGISEHTVERVVTRTAWKHVD